VHCLVMAMWVFCLMLPSLAAAGSFTVYSQPIRLRPGEVHNEYGQPVRIPEKVRQLFAGKPMSLNRFSMDIVELTADQTERSVPLYEMYNHHYLIYAGANSTHELESLLNSTLGKGCHGHLDTTAYSVSFGGATGAEYRRYPFDLPAPYASTGHIDWIVPLLHVINIKKNASLLECPCSAGRVDPVHHTIDGKPISPGLKFNCNAELKKEANPSCSFATYSGGLRCCENGVFLPEHPDKSAPYTEVRMKMTFGYREPSEEKVLPTVPVRDARCCDVTGLKYHWGPLQAGGGGNIEYDIPQCAYSTPRDACIHEASNVQTLDYQPALSSNPNDVVALVQATGHVHKAALSLELIDDATGQVICHVTPEYGSSDRAGDEKGYLVGLKPCFFSTPLKFKRGHLVRTVARYNSSEAHTGVMSLWFLKVVDVTNASASLPADIVV